MGILDPAYEFWGSGGGPIARQWTIGNSGDEYGYSFALAFGALDPDDWFDNIQTIAILTVDDSSNAVILGASDSSQWGGLNSVTLVTEGAADVQLTWNGTFYVVIDAVYSAYIVSEVGNTITVSITP